MAARRSSAVIGLLSVPATVLLILLTPVQVAAYDVETMPWLTNLDGIQALADRIWLDHGGSLDRYEFWGRWTVVGYLGAIAGLWAFRRLSASTVRGSRVLMIALCVAAVADAVVYRSASGSVASAISGTIEFFMLPVILGATIWYGWVLRRPTLAPRWPGWVLIAAAACVPLGMSATNYWPHGLLVPITIGIAVLAVAAAAGLSVERTFELPVAL